MYQLYTINCEGDGFKDYSELGSDIVVFVCSNGNLGRFGF